MILSTHGIVSSISGIDADWLAYYNRVIAAGGSLSTTEQNATKTLVADLKTAGIWSSMKAIYPMVGASAAACAQNLKSSSFTGTFTSGWTFSSLIDMSRCFYNSAAFNQPINNWERAVSTLSDVTASTSMFENSTLFNQNISDWDMNNNTDMSGMFKNSVFNNNSITGITDWNVNSLTNMSSMFENSPFNQPLTGWNVSNVTLMNQAFNNCGLSTLNYSNILIYWSNLPELQPSIVMGATGLNYTTSTAGKSRALLTRPNQLLAISNCVNNGSGLIRVTSAAQTLVTGNKVTIGGVLGATQANGSWIVTVINATTIDLQGSTFFNPYISGGGLRTGCGWTIVGDTGV